MADFIRPAASPSWFEQDETDFCGIYDDVDEALVSQHVELPLIRHPFSSASGAIPATEREAFWFWREGGWDAGN